ncbi:MAG: HAMP domain-containing protein, partial [Lachnospiraceae bacterium]|nr:HAMP domain-containing protein [Lachnospiraceae bacterium]
MKNVKIKVRLIGAFGISMLLMVINVIFGMMAMEKVASTEAEMEKRYADNAVMFSFVILAISIVVTVGLALSIIKEIDTSLKQLVAASKSIAKGQVDIELKKHGENEFGELIDEFKSVIENSKYQSNIAEEVAHGNLTVSVKPASNDDMLGNSLKKLVEDNLRTLSNISEAGSQVTISASQVASASQALAQGSTEQASAIEEITASIDEIAEKTKDNAEQANSAANLVSRAIEDVQQ